MQDRYAGDAGDFSKLGLLRALKPERAGIVWYRVADESHNADGKHTAYLTQRDLFRNLDPALFDGLGDVARAVPRTIACLASRTVPDWVSFDEEVPHGPSRRAWVDRAVAAVSDCDVVCLDPDNGLLPPSVGRGARSARKYATDEEVSRFASGGATVVVYQHLHRQGTAEAQAATLAERLHAATGRQVQVVRYRRGTGRLYGISAPATALMAARVDALVADWHPHFQRLL